VGGRREVLVAILRILGEFAILFGLALLGYGTYKVASHLFWKGGGP